VWTFRERSLYIFAGDKRSWDQEGDAWGEVWLFEAALRPPGWREDFPDTAGGASAE
jgi:hypothetical protein